MNAPEPIRLACDRCGRGMEPLSKHTRAIVCAPCVRAWGGASATAERLQRSGTCYTDLSNRTTSASLGSAYPSDR